MSDLALLIVAHGSSDAPETFASVERHAERLRMRGRFDEVATAYYRQDPPLEDAIETVGCERVVIVPMLMSAGYFATKAIPRKLGIEGIEFDVPVDFNGRQLAYTRPIGTHARLFGLVLDQARELIGERTNAPEDTTLVVVGHGTPRHADSTGTVLDVVERIRETSGYTQVLSVFVDDEPPVDSVLQRVLTSKVVVVPYFVADGPHVTGDIPEALGIDGRWPAENPVKVDGRRVWYGGAVGVQPGVGLLVEELALLAGRTR